MDVSLQKYPLWTELMAWLQDQLWKTCQPCAQESHDMSTYFEYYSIRCQRFSRDGGFHILAKTHSDIVDIAQKILRDETRDAIVRNFEHTDPSLTNDIDNVQSHCANPKDEPDSEKQTIKNADARKINTTIDLCGSLLVMAEIGVHRFGFSGSNPLPWSGSQTLRQAVGHFFQPERALQPDNPKLGRLFTARNLSHIGGMRIKWTKNLVDHLLLSDDDQTVFIFHYSGFLRYQERWLHPRNLRTLTLLFPQNDRKSRRWLTTQTTEHGLDRALLQSGSLRSQDRRFEHFYFWHDRLVILKQAFDESNPRHLRQWWNDRRNTVQWYTFWVAILVFVTTMFFGLVQSVAAILQVWLSWKALASEGEP